jgi:DNA modification methylase
MSGVAMENWKESGLNVESLWLISERDKSGKHSNVYHGNFIPQIPNQLIRRYTQQGDVVLDLFLGSGTTMYECEKLGRKCVGFDINREILGFVSGQMEKSSKNSFGIYDCDVTDKQKFDACIDKALKQLDADKAQFLIAHPPYMDIVKFTDLPEDLSGITDLNDFLERFVQAMANGLAYLEEGKYFAIVIGDVYKKSEVVPLGFYVLDCIKKNFYVKLKGIIVKNIEGNRGKLGAQNIWRYRALKSGGVDK